MKQDRRIQNLKRRMLSAILSTVMAASLVPALAATGLAADAVGTSDSPTLEKLAANMCMGDKVLDFPDGEEQTARLMAEQFPERFDLRSADLDGDGEPENYVTSVKLQNPFGTCWGFGAIAASEISLLSSGLAQQDGYTVDTLDLSEKHLAYFVTQPIDDPDGEVRMANVFRADAAALLEDVSCQTITPGTEVTYNVYLLPEEDPVSGTALRPPSCWRSWRGAKAARSRSAPMSIRRSGCCIPSRAGQ